MERAAHPEGTSGAWTRAVGAIDARLTPLLGRVGPEALRLALGAVFLWFGGLKFVTGASPAEDLAVRTTGRLGAGRIPASLRLRAVATLEVSIGLGLLTRRFLRLTLALFGFQMTAAMLPLALFPREMFRRPWAPTLEGQYVLKNVVLVAAGLVVGARVGMRDSRGEERTERSPASSAPSVCSP